MEQAEIDRRNEAIARFMGESSFVTMQLHGGNVAVIGKREYRDWNALMPVVEKIRLTEGVRLSDKRYKEGHCVEILVHPFGARFFWKSDAPNVTVYSYITAYWLAVSDYCLTLTRIEP